MIISRKHINKIVNATLIGAVFVSFVSPVSANGHSLSDSNQRFTQIMVKVNERDFYQNHVIAFDETTTSDYTTILTSLMTCSIPSILTMDMPFLAILTLGNN